MSTRYEWRSYGGDPGGMRYSRLKQINRSNVAQLERAWTYHTGEIDQNTGKGIDSFAFQCTPIMVDGMLYLSTPNNRIIALNAETGRELWVFDPKLDWTKVHNYPRSRGVAYWEESVKRSAGKRIFFGTNDGRLIALDAMTGKLIAGFGQNGEVDLRPGVADNLPDENYMVTSPPAVYRDLVVVGGARITETSFPGPSGDVRAFDARTGRLVWRFHTVPRPGDFGHETWEGDSWRGRSGVNAWGPLSVDVERGLVFIPLGAPAYDHFGGDRKGQNLFANSVVALEAATGKRVWHYQVVHHDIWDYDIPAQPNLISLRRNGRRIPAVAVLTKSGFVFVFDRRNGTPLFEIKEQPVAKSAVPGEASWPTQPIPVKPPQLVRNRITREQLSRATPESHKYCMELFDSLDHPGGAYQPFGTKPTLRFPGTLGGATWSGASFDPATDSLYVNVNELGTMGWVAGTGEKRAPWPKRFWDQNEWPCQQPPWGKLVAIDLDSGNVRWSVPLGVVEELASRGITDTGAPNLGGSIVTAGGLLFIGGSNDRRFRAFDTRTGKELWVAKLEASGHATPATYRGKSTGRQFVVIAAGGGGYLSRHSGDVLAAFALPASTAAKRAAGGKRQR
ncbi:MAG TPA: pyrroloquinoline quinone-dependent dehydrogenase [Acidobacteriota bacterium]|jgi:quinoprotein glucose dehydrogenase